MTPADLSPDAVLIAGAVLALAVTIVLCTLAVTAGLRALAAEHECDRSDVAYAISSAADATEIAVQELAAAVTDAARDLHDQLDKS